MIKVEYLQDMENRMVDGYVTFFLICIVLGDSCYIDACTFIYLLSHMHVHTRTHTCARITHA